MNTRSTYPSPLWGKIVAFGILAAVSPWLTNIAVHSYGTARTLRDHGQVEVAIVTRTGSEHFARGSKTYIVVDFTTADGRQISAKVHDSYSGDAHAVGDRLLVRYDPQDPENYIQDERQESYFGDFEVEATCATFFWILFITVVVSIWRHIRRIPHCAA